MLIATLGLTLLLAQTDAGKPVQGIRQHEVVCPFGDEFRDPFDFQRNGPLDLIRFLEKEYKQGELSIVTIACFHRGWVRQDDLPALRRFLGSKKRCAAIVSPHESNLPLNGTTVGEIAQVLIDSYERGGFPINLKAIVESPKK